MSATPEQIADLCERLRTELTGYEGLLIEAADALSAQAERVRVLEGALREIAAQKNAAELDDDQYEHADFEGGYGLLIDRARAALRGEA